METLQRTEAPVPRGGRGLKRTGAQVGSPVFMVEAPVPRGGRGLKLGVAIYIVRFGVEAPVPRGGRGLKRIALHERLIPLEKRPSHEAGED